MYDTTSGGLGEFDWDFFPGPVDARLGLYEHFLKVQRLLAERDGDADTPDPDPGDDLC